MGEVIQYCPCSFPSQIILPLAVGALSDSLMFTPCNTQSHPSSQTPCGQGDGGVGSVSTGLQVPGEVISCTNTEIETNTAHHNSGTSYQ